MIGCCQLALNNLLLAGCIRKLWYDRIPTVSADLCFHCVINLCYRAVNKMSTHDKKYDGQSRQYRTTVTSVI